MWPLVVATVASAIFQGISSSNAAKSQAEVAAATAAKNAQLALDAGKWNYDSILNAAGIQMQLGNLSAEVTVNTIMATAEYNADLRIQTAEYNALLLEKEAEEVYQTFELDSLLLEQQMDQVVGDQQAQFAANGIVLGEGSAFNAMVDTRTQEALQRFVLRTNAYNNATSILNEAAITRWNGQAEAASIMYDAKVQSYTTLSSQLIENMGTYAQALYDATSAQYNANLQAQQILAGGGSTVTSLNNAASQAVWTGLANAVSSGVSTYSKTSTTSQNLDTTSTTTETADAATKSTVSLNE